MFWQTCACVVYVYVCVSICLYLCVFVAGQKNSQNSPLQSLCSGRPVPVWCTCMYACLYVYTCVCLLLGKRIHKIRPCRPCALVDLCLCGVRSVCVCVCVFVCVNLNVCVDVCVRVCPPCVLTSLYVWNVDLCVCVFVCVYIHIHVAVCMHRYPCPSCVLVDRTCVV